MKLAHTSAFGLMVTVLLMTSAVTAVEPAQRGIRFASVADQTLLLDLYQQPGLKTPTPVIVWVHGGAWRAGSRFPVPIAALVEQGFAIASVDYRLSPVARFPAQVQDIKAAIRFLRARAVEYHLDPDRIFIAGASAGGHLAALVGVTNRVAALEGEVGEHREISSDVQAVVSLYGAANLQSILDQSTEYGLSVRVPALQLLLGGTPAEQPELARLASPVAHVDAADPPLLLIHGDRDPQMPLQQSQELCDAYRRHKLPVSFHTVTGGVHGGPEFYDAAMLARISTFLQTGQGQHASEPAP